MKVLILFLALFLIPARTLAVGINTATPSSAPKYVQYDLAFPGILPDHPLYKLKTARDKIRTFLLRNPKKKIGFYLLKTDKEILATAILVDKKKYDLATHTAFKAENNYTLLTFELHKLEKAPSGEFFKRLETAALKHQEVLTSLINRVPKEKKKPFEQVRDFSITNLETVEKYQKEALKNTQIKKSYEQ